jgi:hypothetical protein
MYRNSNLSTGYPQLIHRITNPYQSLIKTIGQYNQTGVLLGGE